MAHKYIASCKFIGDATGHNMRTHASVGFPRVRQTATQEDLTLARIRLPLEDDAGRAITGDKERRDDWAVGAPRLVDLAAAIGCLKQAALPALPAELVTLAPHRFVAEGNKGAASAGRGRGAARARPGTEPLRAWSNGFRAPSGGSRPIWRCPSHAARGPCVRAERSAAPPPVTGGATKRAPGSWSASRGRTCAVPRRGGRWWWQKRWRAVGSGRARGRSTRLPLQGQRGGRRGPGMPRSVRPSCS
jgi:hypothetical protein